MLCLSSRTALTDTNCCCGALLRRGWLLFVNVIHKYQIIFLTFNQSIVRNNFQISKPRFELQSPFSYKLSSYCSCMLHWKIYDSQLTSLSFSNHTKDSHWRKILCLASPRLVRKDVNKQLQIDSLTRVARPLDKDHLCFSLHIWLFIARQHSSDSYMNKLSHPSLWVVITHPDEANYHMKWTGNDEGKN